MAKKINSIEEFLTIRQSLIDGNDFYYKPKAFSDSREWGLYDGTIRREDGNFFSIIGLRVTSINKKPDLISQCPIIYQPTNAINGFLIRHDRNGLEILFQARVEPGNTGVVQLAPTVQSTEANYKQLHGGGPTSYINNFLKQDEKKVFYKGLQSEEASRYHGKYNLYIITEAGEEDFSTDKDDFYILNSETIKDFICDDYIINTDARGLLFFLDWDLLGRDTKAFAGTNNPVNKALMKSYSYNGNDLGTDVLNSIGHIMHARASTSLRTNHIPLDSLENWELSEDILNEKVAELGFTVSLFEVQAKNREVAKWDQPLITSDSEGRVILFCRINKGVMEFLISMDWDIGYLEGVQYTATLSVAPGKSPGLFSEEESLLIDIADSVNSDQIIIECCQSEEGGRFNNDINRYQIILLDGEPKLPNIAEYKWMTLSQIKTLGDISSMLSIELRCALALLIKLT